MKTVVGLLNGTLIENLLTQSYPTSREITAAVAYADYREPLVQHIKKHPGVALTFYCLLDENEAVSLKLLRWFLRDAPSNARCHLVRGAYHPKLIWWHGFGAYIGSGNLTENGWRANIECGVFFTEDELADEGLAEGLESMLAEIEKAATPLTDELLSRLEAIAEMRKPLNARIAEFETKAGKELALYSMYTGQTRKPPRDEKKPSKAQLAFVRDWRETLQLMRTVCREFHALGIRPSWVPKDTNPTVHFDQFLHGYYYHRVLRSFEEGDSMSKVEKLFGQNKTNPAFAMKEAAHWWGSLSEGPSKARYDEEAFIRQRAPRMAELFAAESLASISEDAFVEGMSNVYAFRDHARQVGNEIYGLPTGYRATEEERAEMFARLVWSRRSAVNTTAVDLLRFVVWGANPLEAEERLWMGDRSKEWKVQGLGPSTLGEILGWARPDRYPPRNDRTNKALRSLGYDVRVFNQGKAAMKD